MIGNPLRIAFSPCPNDTFMFDGLVNQRFHFDLDLRYDLLDIEKLNDAALQKHYDLTKISFAVYPFVAHEYQLLTTGAALGHACGPILVCRPDTETSLLSNLTVAIPGLHTTANLLLTILFPEITRKKVLLFSEIEDAVNEGLVDAGLIIHENRFTYEDKGLVKIADLGEVWEKLNGLPVPLGGIAIRRSLPIDLKIEISSLLKQSIKLAMEYPERSKDFVSVHAQEMNPEVQQQHIDLYVNNFSIDIEEQGASAIQYLFDKGIEANLLPLIKDPVFLTRQQV